MRKKILNLCTALFSASLLVQPALAASTFAVFTPPEAGAVENGQTFIAPQAHGAELNYLNPITASGLTHDQIVALVKSKIKYVFVIYQENRSFDSYFGTYPGADGIYSAGGPTPTARSAANTPGYFQPVPNTHNNPATANTVVPFLIGPSLYAWDTDDLDHSHAASATSTTGLQYEIDTQSNGVALMDRFGLDEENKYPVASNASNPTKGLGYGELAMAHEDCNTIPFLWSYADKFVLFDHMFQDMTGPSTPGNLTIFAAQSGQTQYALHPDESYTNTSNFKAPFGAAGEPVLNDNNPLWGSGADPNGQTRVPRDPTDSTAGGIQVNQTYATLAVTTAGKNATATFNSSNDADPTPSAETADLADIADDIPYVTQLGKAQVGWGWYEEGYDAETSDSVGAMTSGGSHASYVTHHNGPQYFGYVANNPIERANLHGLGDFYTAITNGTLPASGGVFYLKGGFTNNLGLTPDNPLSVVQGAFKGDDDHPAYSDAQISEAVVAKDVDAIANSKYWPNAAIIITWDDSEGDYDHVPPPAVVTDQNGFQESYGPRVPMIVISPYAKVHAVASEQDSQASVVKFVDEVFGLPPLATLPDEVKGFKAGVALGQAQLGPQDNNAAFGDLMTAFDDRRLRGLSPTLPASYVTIPASTYGALPAYGGNGCTAIGITPEDAVLGITNTIPSDFNPLPGTTAKGASGSPYTTN
jgi:phospholipase C